MSLGLFAIPTVHAVQEIPSQQFEGRGSQDPRAQGQSCTSSILLGSGGVEGLRLRSVCVCVVCVCAPMLCSVC